ncbi:hybrid sensor histidine kinase/response regulator [bacterium]|nr:MAG: hybrid sensor histidine kinase/response regulator [bacterium]
MSTDRRPLRVLLIDDDEDDFLLTRDILIEGGKGGFAVDHESTAEGGLARIATGVHDVILLDYSLGVVDGLSVLEAAVGGGCDRPIIMLTGQEDQELAQRALRLGAADYMAKGRIDYEGLSRAIRYSLERKSLENRLRRFNSELEHAVEARTADLKLANEELRGFTYTVSHDLRAPLRAIVGNARILKEDYGEKLGEDAQALIERQVIAANRLGKIIDDLLTLSRLGQSKLEERTVDMTALFRLAIAEAGSLHPKLTIEAEVPEGMNASADERLIRFAVLNLVENAVKFAKPGQPSSITIHYTDQGGVAQFDVQDKGVGFDMEYESKIWRPFERLVRDEDVAGTGIGLANVRRIVERHGGRTWAKAAMGVGATISFTLPSATAESHRSAL